MDPVQLAERLQDLPAPVLYLVIVLWLSLESSGVPLPNEAILLFAGYQVSAGRADPFLAAAAGVIGSLIGASLSYGIGYHFGRPGVQRLGRYVMLSEHRLGAADRWFRRRGRLTIFLARLTPVIRTVISYPAGIARMPYRGFFVSTLGGAAIWCALVVTVGALVGRRWLLLFDWVHRLGLVAAAVIVLAVVVYVVLEYRMKVFSR